MYQRVGKTAFKKNLDNILALCEALGNPQDQYPTIHLAGTNGKGTTAHLLSAALQSHGYKTGLYTSPHYRDFRERIKIDGQLISRKQVIRFVAEHQSLIESIQPSFFEITVALAFHCFAQAKVDFAVIETGLGGRLDSTNIIQPILSIITNISLDHQQLLGNTLPEIAGEKAGIIKTQIPVVVGEEQAAVKAVFVEKAKQEKSKLYFADQAFQVEFLEFAEGASSIYRVWKEGKVFLDHLQVDLRGPFQRKNLATLFQSLDVLERNGHIKIVEDRLRYALLHLRQLSYYIGRWQILGTAPLTITDSAHNEAGLSIVMKAIQELPKAALHIVLGTVNDKELAKVLRLMPKEARYYFARPNIPRGLAAKDLQDQAAAFGFQGRTYSSVKNAWRAARRRAQSEDVIFIGGSTFVVAEVIPTRAASPKVIKNG